MGARTIRAAVVSLFAAAVISLGSPSPVGVAQESGGAVSAPHVPGEVLVKFKRGTPGVVKAAVAAGVGKIAREYAKHQESARGREFFDELVLLQLEGALDVADAVKALSNNPNVEYAEPNYLVTADNTPNDAYYEGLWGMHNTGQSGGTADADIDAPEAWDITTGSSSIIVAVIDTGVNYKHPDLDDNMWTNPDEIAGNGIDDDGNGFIDDVRGWDWVNNDNDPMDDNSHGSHVAGTIAAEGNNGFGVAGVTWSSRIMPLKFLNASGSGSTSNAVLAVQYAVNKGAKVLSNSYGSSTYLQSFQDAVTAANNAGAMFVASAGNDNTFGGQYPAKYQGVISVAALDHNDAKASFSSYGTWVDISAPGVGIYSTTWDLSMSQNGVYDTYGFKSGTSMSTPMVSGICALLLGYGVPKATAEKLLINTADDINVQNSGLIGYMGSGRANARNALQGWIDAAGDTTPPTTPGGLTATALNGRQVSLNLATPSTDDVRLSGYKVEYNIGFGWYPIGNTRYTTLPFIVSDLTPQYAHQFRVSAYDIMGNTSATSNEVSVTTLANTQPDVPSTPSGLARIGTGVSHTYTFVGTDADADKLTYEIWWGDATQTLVDQYKSGVTVSATHTWATAGAYTIYIKATDLSGAYRWSAGLPVDVAATHPPEKPTNFKCTSSGTTYVAAAGYTADFSAYCWDRESNGLQATFDWGDGTTTTTGNLNGAGAYAVVGKAWLTPGIYEVKVRASDTSDPTLISEWTSPLYVIVKNDTVAPQPPVLTATPISSSQIALSWNSAYDDVGTKLHNVYKSTDGVTFTLALSRSANSSMGTFTSGSLLPNTTYYHKVVVTDFPGNSATSNVVMTTTLPVGAPPATPSDPSGPASGNKGTSYSYTTSATDPDGDQIKYTYDWGDGQQTTTGFYASGATASASHSWISLGTYLVKVKATDANNNVSGWSNTVTVDIVNRVPSTPSTPSGATSGQAGLSYNYTTSATDPDGDTIKYTYDWGDGQQTTTGFYASGATASASHSWSAAGTYLVTVKAIDVNGGESGWSTALSVVITANQPPATPSTPAGPASGSTGTSYTYTTSSTDPNGDTIKYTYDWGDGQQTTTGFYASGATASASHSWSAAGTYLVSVKAIDSNNAESGWSTTLTVTISAPQPDLVTDSVTFTATSVRRGRSFTVTSAVRNQGNATAGASTIAFRLSTNTVWGDGDDIIVTATRSVGSLAAGATSTGNTSITVPSSTPLGYYYVLGYADSQGVVVESVETNNSKSSTNRIQVKN